MLSKLLKLETKASARFLLPTYLVLIVISILNRITLSLGINEGILMIIPALLVFTYVTAIIVVMVTTFILMISRFYKNFLTDEGYLMFTLPVKISDLILSKLIVTFCYTIISAIVGILSMFIIVANGDIIKQMSQFFSEGYNQLISINMNIPFVIFISIVLIISAIISNTLSIYVSIALGQLYKKHKLIGSFIAYIAIYTALQILATIIVVIGSLTLINFSLAPTTIFYIFTIATSLAFIILSIVFYYVTIYMFKKKLNLD